MTRSAHLARTLIALVLIGAANAPTARAGDGCPAVLTVDLDAGTPGPRLVRPEGPPVVGGPFSLRVENGGGVGAGVLFLGSTQIELALPEFGATLFVGPPVSATLFLVDALGSSAPLLSIPALPAELCGLEVVAQAAVISPDATGGAAFSNGNRLRVGVPGSPRFALPLLEGSSQNGANDVLASDYNGDGLVDLAISVGAKLHIRLSDGLGSFQEPIITGSGYNENFGMLLVGGDFTGDGIDDFALGAEVENELTIFESLGDGTVLRREAYALGDSPQDLHAADVDLDGFVDIISANQQSDDLRILRGEAGGLFSIDPISLPVSGFPNTVDVADLNSDGWPDLIAAAAFGDGVTVYRGIDGQSFEPAATYDPGVSSPLALQTTDLDGDGALEVVLCGTNSDQVVRMSVLPDGTLGAPAAYSVCDDPEALTIADLNGDGLLDVAVACRLGRAVALLFGKQDGTFFPADIVPLQQGCANLVAGDWNGDGLNDLAVTQSVDTALLYGTGAGALLGLPTVSVVDDGIRAFAAADLNADGVLDLVAQGSGIEGRKLTALQGDGLGSFAPFPVAALPAGLAGQAPVLNDWNGDGQLDLVVSATDGSALEFWSGNGDGSFAGPTFVAGEPGEHLAPADLDGNGTLDVVHFGDSFDAATYLADTGGTFGSAIVFSTSLKNDNTEDATAADFNGDGHQDVASVHGTAPSDKMPLVVGLGDGAGSAFSALSFSTNDHQFADALAVGDLNLNGTLDIAVAHMSEDEISIMAGDGSGAFVLRRSLATQTGIGEVQIGDLNSDGWPDLAVTASGANFFNVHDGLGGFRFERGDPFAVYSSTRMLLLEDVDLDGALDVLATNLFLEPLGLAEGGISFHRNLLGSELSAGE